MRLFALAIVEDRLDFYNRVVRGEHIRNIKDGEGKKMTDSHLSKELESHFPGFRLLYENTSAFIHFSNEHINLNTDRIDTEEKFIMFIRLAETTELPIYMKVDFAYNMFIAGKNVLNILNGYKSHMEDFLKNLNFTFKSTK